MKWHSGLIFVCGLLAASEASAGFDWNGCEGEGNFVQYVQYFSDVEVGLIPQGSQNVRVELDSSRDVDIRLRDESDNTLVVWWNSAGTGLLSGATSQCLDDYKGMKICYSGYNGVNGEKGHEYIEITGYVSTDFRLSAFGYAAGDADVSYTFDPQNTCNEIGSGTFTQAIAHQATTDVGVIPTGKVNVEVQLTSNRDVDIQLWDGDHAIVAWPSGDLNGPSEQTITYKDMAITYSGYNGLNGDWGQEFIRIAGRVETDLSMKAFGYAAGTAQVDYNWGEGAGKSCQTFVVDACGEDLYCKGYVPEGGVTNWTGTCHSAQWCTGAQGQEAIDQYCSGLPKAEGERFSCEDFECTTVKDLSTPAGLGETCYQFTENGSLPPVSRECAIGLKCVAANPDAIGFNSHRTCQNAQVGETCGGFSQHPVFCAEGLSCYNPQWNMIPDLSGLCYDFETCDGQRDAFNAAHDSINYCNQPSDCQAIQGTSCGCTRNLVGNASANMSSFEERHQAMNEAGCGLFSTCDCPAVDPAQPFKCEENKCSWNYTSSSL